MPDLTPTWVLKVAVFSHFNTLFDYLPPANLSFDDIPIGARVKVPFATRFLIGLVIEYGPTTFAFESLKAVIEILDKAPLFPEPTWNLLFKAHQYYHHSLGDAIQTGLPLALRQGKPLLPLEKCTFLHKEINSKAGDPLILNDDQAKALAQINKAHKQFTCFLLQGVTGSGKTEVYLQAIQLTRLKKHAVLVLIPEIALTPQTLERFQARFNEPIGVYHSQMTDKQRLVTWCAIYHQEIQIILGTRSALFLPIQNLGLIIIDEEHDSSFKQQEGFRYSARDMAVLLAQQQNIPIVLGSATPSFESIHNVNQKKYSLLPLPTRAGIAKPPELKVLDVRHKKLEGGLSNALISDIKVCLQRQEQVLIFLNRRGYAPALMCFDCGWFAECKRCDKRFTYHRESQCLRCHHCEARRALPAICLACQSQNIQALGVGTEKLEETLQTLFKDYTQVRIDKDTTSRKGELQSRLNQIIKGEAQILIGTQLLAKGHHFPNVTLVAIIDVDGGLFSTDFRAVERMGQLITQVAGRAGRGERKGQVILQTCQPNHALLQSIVQQNYNEFAQNLLLQRQACGLPPFSHFALIRASGSKVGIPEYFLRQLKNALLKLNLSAVSMLGPVPAPMAKRQNHFRFQLLFQSQDRGQLHYVLKQLNELISAPKSELGVFAKRLRWSIDVDPIEMG